MPEVYYSTCKVIFRIRVEDFKREAPRPAPPGTGDAEAFSGSNKLGVQDPTPSEVESANADIAFTVGKRLDYAVVPYSCRVTKNSYREADRCQLVIPFAKFPFDPRILRAAGVQVFGGSLRGDVFARQYPGVGSAPQLTVPDVNIEEGTSNEIFRGFCDDWELTLDDKEPQVRVSARDFTAQFLDEEIPPNQVVNIPPKLPIDQVIRLIINGSKGVPQPTDGKTKLPLIKGLPGVSGMGVVNEAVDDKGRPLRPLPGLGDFHAPSWFDSKRTAKKNRSGGAKSKINYWDFITDIVVAAGLTVYIRPGTVPVFLPGVGFAPPAAEIVITNPRTYYKDAGANVPAGVRPDFPEGIRRYVYGVNVQEITFRRNLGGKVTPTVEVRSFDTRARQSIVERFPPVSKTTKAQPSAAGDRETVRVVTINGLSGERGRKTARLYARNIYEQLGRDELQVTIMTTSQTAFPIRRERAARSGIYKSDIFQLSPGDPIEVVVNLQDSGASPVGQVSVANAFYSYGERQRADFLEKAGYNRQLASAIAASSVNPAVQKEFRTQEVDYNWDYSRGWDFRIQAINYLDVRNSIDTNNSPSQLIVDQDSINDR